MANCWSSGMVGSMNNGLIGYAGTMNFKEIYKKVKTFDPAREEEVGTLYD
ncbi:MAG: hypothetical protein AAGH46_04750 [Bacteroidota bacterium]